MIQSIIQFFTFRLLFVLIAFAIGIGSVLYTNQLVDELAEHEYRQIDLFAKVQSLIITSDDSEMSQLLLTEVIEGNTSIPVILADEQDQVLYARNIDIDSTWTQGEIDSYLKDELEEMRAQHPPTEIDLGFFKQKIYFKNSPLITKLQYYPYIQLSIIAIFAIFVYFVYSSSKAAEQNRVWVGLAKETAHQLGTPLSSLMAWVEFFRADDSFDQDIVHELDKDVQRLEMITSRFSSIGSVPTLKKSDIYGITSSIVDYLQKRVSKKVNFTIEETIDSDLNADVNVPLFEWVIENVCKNAVDAMGGKGAINIKVQSSKDKKNIIIDIKDTGKGIPKSKMKKVFQPGFTTKKRGWGLGLTLVKRIIENYHKGKIYVAWSEVNVGTTFRIILPKNTKIKAPKSLAQRTDLKYS